VAIAHDQEEEEEEEEENDDPCSENNEDVIDFDQDASSAHDVPPTPTKQNGVIFYGKQLRKVFFEGHRRERRPQVRKHVEVEFPMTVASTNTSVDVLWQDGTLQHGVPSASLVPFDVMNEQEFFPGEHIVENDTTVGTNGDNDGTTKRVGIVRSLDCKDQTVCVSWLKAGICPGEAREVECIETISAYDLQLNYSPYYGDIVVRLMQSELTNSNVDLSWVGRVADLPDGHVQVRWADGSMSKVR
jgi:ubiquitin-conjugating enzyme E2 O